MGPSLGLGAGHVPRVSSAGEEPPPPQVLLCPITPRGHASGAEVGFIPVQTKVGEQLAPPVTLVHVSHCGVIPTAEGSSDQQAQERDGLPARGMWSSYREGPHSPHTHSQISPSPLNPYQAVADCPDSAEPGQEHQNPRPYHCTAGPLTPSHDRWEHWSPEKGLAQSHTVNQGQTVLTAPGEKQAPSGRAVQREAGGCR